MSKQPSQIKDNKKADCTRQSNQSASVTTNSQPKGNESMDSLALSFNDVTFNPVAQNDGQIWLTSTQVAEALGYSNAKSISNLYNANKDEFTNDMTKVIELESNGNAEVITSVTSKNLRRTLRIFSLRGCHLLGFFANTKLAKQFRIWVLDILDKEVGQPIVTRVTISIEQQKAIRTAIAKRCQQTSAHYQTVYTALYEHFNIPRYSELLVKDFDEALRFIRSVKLAPVVEQIPFNSDFAQSMLLLGRAKVEDNKAAISVLEKAMFALDHALETIKRNNATQYSVFENLNYQLVEQPN